VLKYFLENIKQGQLPRAAIFLSGGGSNAEKVLEARKSWTAAVLVTDAPEKSRAAEIAARFELPLIEFSIRKFYREHGEKRVSLATENGRRIRELWTEGLRRKISPYNIDFGILAGFVPLSNITGDFPCLNVHPGDLTVECDGVRIFAGLHAVPTEQAIVRGFKSIRSSVIIAQPYTGKGGEMDSGPVLGISPEMELDLYGRTFGELAEIYRNRSAKKPVGGFKDALSEIASSNQERLKEKGDWVVFPQAVNDFAAGKFAVENSELYFRSDGKFSPVGTIEYKAAK
jgi:folate-dependent phosphoribosylglycinamide formyltransferase PurN